MAVTLDATLGGPSSNSYVDMATAMTIAQNIPGGGDWAVLDEEARNLSLIVATRWLETLPYAGDRCDAAQRPEVATPGATCDGITSSCDSILTDQEAEVTLAISYSKNPSQFPGEGSGGASQEHLFPVRSWDL